MSHTYMQCRKHKIQAINMDILHRFGSLLKISQKGFQQATWKGPDDNGNDCRYGEEEGILQLNKSIFFP